MDLRLLIRFITNIIYLRIFIFILISFCFSLIIVASSKSFFETQNPVTLKLNQQQALSDLTVNDKIEGMLIGSAIGDAAGGPVEFLHPPLRSKWTTNDEKITIAGIQALADSFRLRSYSKNAEPFAQWEPYGPPGTITDDTRWKLIFFNTLRNHSASLNRMNFAREVENFRETLPDSYKVWYDRWIPEIRFATRWVLGEREDAYPPDRIWGGIPTMAGQMPFLPLAALFPDNPQKAYLKTWELGFIDVGVAKDINAALVAGLVGALQPGSYWDTVEHYMRQTDPYNFSHVLYVPRRLNEWLDTAGAFVNRANGNIKRLFEILENELQARTWWEAWVPIVVVFSCAEIVEYEPLAAMQLMIEFGHDTDSYAQVMGAILGAIHGKSIFPEEIRDTVNGRMKDQFGQNINDWMVIIENFR